MSINTVKISPQNMSLDQWVDYIQTLHYREIELSLERVRDVYLRLYPQGMQCEIISLSGTNGKGSTAELCSSIYRSAGYQVGKFTSPHLVKFNERIEINGIPVNDDELLVSFKRIETVRRDTPITFFEFGTLLAIDLFVRANVDIAIMEVGLGGRLDSVNILDADVAITTSVALDHTSWLGDTIEKIAFEKAGIARTNKPYIVGLRIPPSTLLKHSKQIDADLQLVGQAFNYSVTKSDWNWSSANGVEYHNLPLPYAQADVQISNCALALQAVTQLQKKLPVTEMHVKAGIAAASLTGRCQIVSRKPLIVFDVSHNEASVKRLADFLTKHASRTPGSTCVAVCGMLKDKEISASLGQLVELIDVWHTATIDNERGATSADIAERLHGLTTAQVDCYDSAQLAYKAALNLLGDNDCLVVFGSFHIVGDILKYKSVES